MTRWCCLHYKDWHVTKKPPNPHVGYVRICQSRITLSLCPPKPRVKPKANSTTTASPQPSPSPLPHTTRIQGAIPNGGYRPLKPPHKNQKKKQFELKNQTVDMERVPKPLTITKKQWERRNITGKVERWISFVNLHFFFVHQSHMHRYQKYLFFLSWPLNRSTFLELGVHSEKSGNGGYWIQIRTDSVSVDIVYL